jgi:predicted acetyltransferase
LVDDWRADQRYEREMVPVKTLIQDDPYDQTMPPLTVHRATAADRAALQRMLELYQHDLSHLWDQDLDAQGEYGYDLDRYFADANCHAFVATADGHYAGFALVDQAVKAGQTGRWMDQFFILKKYRGQGLGETLARHTFQSLPGPWEVGQMPNNTQAQAFWRRVIGQHTQGCFEEHQLATGWWQGVVQRFIG